MERRVLAAKLMFKPFDGALHAFVHRNSTLRGFRTFNFRLGHTPLARAVTLVERADGPTGVIDDFARHSPVRDGVIDAHVVVRRARSEQVRGTSAALGSSMGLPGVFKVESFPLPGTTHSSGVCPSMPDLISTSQPSGERCKPTPSVSASRPASNSIGTRMPGMASMRTMHGRAMPPNLAARMMVVGWTEC